jgi:hypothetical protein
MPDEQIHPTGTVAVPADYKIPPTAELLLKNAYAHFDGSGAAGSFLPLVRIISDAGSVVVEAVADTTIAAGASADASWFPHLASKPAPSTATTLPFAVVTQANNTFPPHNSATTTYGDLTDAFFWTSDSSVIDSVLSPGAPWPAGVNFVTIKAAGTYLFEFGATFTDTHDHVPDPLVVPVHLGYSASFGGGPNGGNDSGLYLGPLGTSQRAVYGYTPDSLTPGTGNSEWDYNALSSYSIGSSVPTPIALGGWQNSGHTLDMSWGLTITRIGPTNLYA